MKRALPVLSLGSPDEAANFVAGVVADTVQGLPRGAVLGLATGNTQIPMYAELVRRYRDSGLSFAHARSFNLDEYHALAASSPLSFHRYMLEHLFQHIDAAPGSWMLPRGDLPDAAITEHCMSYEAAIVAAGGIDLMVLGIGTNGHIGFNEPGAPHDCRTRLVQLELSTRSAAAPSFGGIEAVPKNAITMGIATILSAKRILLLATGEPKGRALAEAVGGPISLDCPATALQRHDNVLVVADATAAAAAGLEPLPRPQPQESG